MTSAIDGVIYIDYKDMDAPVSETIEGDFEKQGYSVCIVNTGGSHSNLTGEYASIPREMLLVAQALNFQSMCEVNVELLPRSSKPWSLFLAIAVITFSPSGIKVELKYWRFNRWQN